MNATSLRILMNWWPPFAGAGIKVKHVARDFSHVEVQLNAPFWKRNYVGTHFGGSLYAMTDPFYMLMLLKQLGPDYWVWDLSARIDYKSPARGPVTAHFRLLPDHVAALRAQAANGDKVLPEYQIDITDAGGGLVAQVQRTLYVRLKKRHRPEGADLRAE